MKKILLADDNRTFVNLAKEVLENSGFEVKAATYKQQVFDLLEKEKFDIFLLDLNLPYSNIGMEILNYSLEKYSDLPVVMISGDASIEGALSAIRQGAMDFIEKPVKRERLILTINNVLERNEIKREMQIVQKQAINMIGNSEPMQRLYQEILKISQSEFPVLIKGETGTGKDLVARAIHNLSKRNKTTLVDFNCSAIPGELWESELFGHNKGSFTGAYQDKKGYLELADKGTIFMDEIGCMPLEVQPKLLRFLENGVIQKVGSDIQKVDVRVISATNVDLEELMKNNLFREDLLIRLNVLEISVPALRDHKEDIPDLAKHFLMKDCSKEGVDFKELSPEAIHLLMDHHWSGNIRELKNVIDRALVFSSGTIINPEVIRKAFKGKLSEKKRTLREATDEFEKDFIKNNLVINDWNVTQTADKIAIERSNLYKKIKHHKIKIRKD